MKISEYIKSSLDASDRRELDQALLFACLAVDGTAKKMYPNITRVGDRFTKFITDNIDIIELMHGGLNLKETVFPFPDKKGNKGLKFENIIYEKIRCNLAHGSELPNGYKVECKVTDNTYGFAINIKEQSMTLPESVIYALGLPCVLSPANSDQIIGSNVYFYNDPNNHYIIDDWWGQVNSARKVMQFDSQPRVKINFEIINS